MKTILLCAFGARYSHSSLALLYLRQAAAGRPVSLAEYNINESPAKIVESIVSSAPDAVGFSCYIWNIGIVLQVASSVKKLLPGCTILLGGPEVSFDAPSLMKENGFIDIIICGPGEAPFRRFADAFCRDESISGTPSACIRTNGGLLQTPGVLPLPLADIPFVYDDLSPYANKIIYHETSRGCPFRCAYCLSAETSLDFLPASRAIHELEFFMQHDGRQVKLVDRTFNYPDDRARNIFSALIALKEKYPESRTNYHFEISASLLTEETLAMLESAPAGLFQFEVGIQSTHDKTLHAVGRGHNTKKVLDITNRLCRMQNLHVHVDLIAGLPIETAETFAASFNDAYRLSANRLQLGFLKLLKGSPLRAQAEQFGIVYTDGAPYEVLKTDTMSYSTLRRLHRIESLLDTLYNDRAARQTLGLLTSLMPPYDVFNQFAAFLERRGFFERPQKQGALYEQLFAFASGLSGMDISLLRESLAFDWFSRQNTDCPAPFSLPDTGEQKAFARRFFEDADAVARYLPDTDLTPRQLERRCRVVFFQCLFGSPSAVLFDYGKKPDDAGFYKIIPSV
jgi:radical SAM superfamily enzyme YgiQ (UPF0313 family)